MKSIEQKYWSHICFPSIETQIEKLPTEVLAKIFSYLSLLNRINTSQVCQHWRAVIISLYEPEKNKIRTINDSLQSLIRNINCEKYKKIIEKIETLIAVNLTQSDLSFRDLQMEKARVRDECARYLTEIDEKDLKLVDLSWPANERGALADVIRIAGRLFQYGDVKHYDSVFIQQSIIVEFITLGRLEHLDFAAGVANQMKDVRSRQKMHVWILEALVCKGHFYSFFEKALLIAGKCTERSDALDFLPRHFLDAGALDQAERILKVKPELAKGSIKLEIAYALFKRGRKERAAGLLGIEFTDSNLEAIKKKFSDLESFFASCEKFKKIRKYVDVELRRRFMQYQDLKIDLERRDASSDKCKLYAAFISASAPFLEAPLTEERNEKTLAQYFALSRKVTQQFVIKAFQEVEEEEHNIFNAAKLCLEAGDVEACDELLQSLFEKGGLPEDCVGQLLELADQCTAKLREIADLSIPCSEEIDALIQKKPELIGVNLLDTPLEPAMFEHSKDALDYAHSIPHPSIRASALMEISTRLASKGLKDQALQLIEEIPPKILNFKKRKWSDDSKYLKTAALCAAVEKCLDRKDFAGARMFAEGIPDAAGEKEKMMRAIKRLKEGKNLKPTDLTD
jgi:hypothetical protein